MKYKYLNEVLLNWNSDEDFQDNNIIKSSDIKKEIEQCLIYRVDDGPSRIRIFNVNGQMWEEFKKYNDKVYINGKHVELIDGETVDKFKSGEYRVYIKDIDQVEDTGYMFYDCPQLIKAYIPNTVTSIGGSTFRGCSNLTSVTIPNSVKLIGDNAFSWCSGLMSVAIPNSITSIGDYTFYNCGRLTAVAIPNSVTYIGTDAFSGCINIQTVYVEDINKFKQIDFGLGCSNPLYYGAKLIELQNYEI